MFISVGEHRGVATSIPQFVQHIDSQASETPIPDTTDTIIKTSHAATSVVTTQERHRDLESKPDDDEVAYGV